MNDCFTNPPTVAGKYNVLIDGIMTFMPIFWEFDPDRGWKTDNWVNELKEGTAGWFPNK